MQSFDDFLKSDPLRDRPIVMVEVLDWDTQVPTRKLSSKERAEINALYHGGAEPKPIEAQRAMLSRCLCTNEGKRLTPDIIDRVMDRSATGLDQLSEQLMEINFLSPEAKQKLLEKK